MIYNVFRIKLVPGYQLDLFPPRAEMVLADVLKAALSSQPTVSVREGIHWHLGNLRWLEAGAGACAIGRTTQTTIESFNAETRRFADEPLDASPYTSIVFDVGLGLAAIGQKSKVAVKTTVAQRFGELLQSADAVRTNGLQAVVAPIHDPKGFIEKLHEARRVVRFTAWFTGPNPIDADELFQKPLTVYARALHAGHGKVVVEGRQLEVAPIAGVARSTAATGNDATARIVKQDGVGATIRLSGDQIAVEHPGEDQDLAAVLQAMRVQFGRVRDGE